MNMENAQNNSSEKVDISDTQSKMNEIEKRISVIKSWGNITRDDSILIEKLEQEKDLLINSKNKIAEGSEKTEKRSLVMQTREFIKNDPVLTNIYNQIKIDFREKKSRNPSRKEAIKIFIEKVSAGDNEVSKLKLEEFMTIFNSN